MSKKKTTKQFIEEARLVHGDRYDYSKSEYVNATTKVIIVCPIHGEFSQRPCDHLNGHGCKHCFYEENGKQSRKGVLTRSIWRSIKLCSEVEEHCKGVMEYLDYIREED